LDSDQTARLTRISYAKSEELKRVQRAKILLMAANGASDDLIARAVDLNKNSVRNTIAKFTSMGLEGALADLPRSGKPATIDDEAKTWLKSQARAKPKDLGYERELWTIKTLTSHVHGASSKAGHKVLTNISPSKVWLILEEDEPNPQRIPFCLKRRKPGFERKIDEA
jgi:transposase